MIFAKSPALNESTLCQIRRVIVTCSPINDVLVTITVKRGCTSRSHLLTTKSRKRILYHGEGGDTERIFGDSILIGTTRAADAGSGLDYSKNLDAFDTFSPDSDTFPIYAFPIGLAVKRKNVSNVSERIYEYD